MRCDILTLFPDMVVPVLSQSILKRAQERGLLHIHVRNLRDYTLDRHKVADDVPYGGGAGMVMIAVSVSAWASVHAGLCKKFGGRPTSNYHSLWPLRGGR